MGFPIALTYCLLPIADCLTYCLGRILITNISICLVHSMVLPAVVEPMPTPEDMWAPGGLGSQPEDVSYHDSDVDMPPVFRGRAPPVVGLGRGAWADYIL